MGKYTQDYVGTGVDVNVSAGQEANNLLVTMADTPSNRAALQLPEGRAVIITKTILM